MSVILIISIVLVIVVLLILLSIYVFSPVPKCEKFMFRNDGQNSESNYRDIDYKDIKSQFKSGDLIFLSGDTFQEKLVKCTLNCPFSHIAMIVKMPESGELYLWEADLGQRKKDGPRLISLDEKLKYYKGLKIGAWLKIDTPREIQHDQINSIIKENINKGMQDRLYGWLFSKHPESRAYNLFTDKNKVYCSELVADTLQRLAIMGGDQIPCYFTPADFYYGKIKLQPGVKIYKPIKFNF